MHYSLPPIAQMSLRHSHNLSNVKNGHSFKLNVNGIVLSEEIKKNGLETKNNEIYPQSARKLCVIGGNAAG